MSKTTATINARGAVMELQTLGGRMENAFDCRYADLMEDDSTTQETVNNIDLAIGNCDYIMKAIRKQRRKLVRARYEFRKEHEANGDEKND